MIRNSLRTMRHSTITLIISILTFVNVNVMSQSNKQIISVYFESNKDSTSLQRIDSVLKTSSLLFADSLQLIGYCDSDGSVLYNEDLAMRRIRFVESAINPVTSGKNHLTRLVAKGELNPSYPNDNEVNKAKNRRVELVIFKTNKLPSPNQSDSSSVRKADYDTAKVSVKQAMTIELLNQKIDESIRTGDNIELNDILFRPGLDVFQPNSMATLEVLYKVLSTRRELKIEIQGHVCCVDDNQFDGKNYRSGSNHLSEDRAQAVKEYLVNLGINPKNIRTRGLGGSKRKVYPERSEEDRARNRRVEIKIIP